MGSLYILVLFVYYFVSCYFYKDLGLGIYVYKKEGKKCKIVEFQIIFIIYRRNYIGVLILISDYDVYNDLKFFKVYINQDVFNF